VFNATVDSSTTYTAGDVAPYASNASPNFGDGALNILDLIQELFAVNNVPGFQPAQCSDRFDAMDLYPADAAGTRGGDGSLDIRDLILELFRVNNLDPARPLRTSLSGLCAVGGTAGTTDATAAQRKGERTVGRPVAFSGALVLGSAELSGAGYEHAPVYLEAAHDLVRVAVTLGLGDQRSLLRFVAAPDLPPSLLEDGQPGVVAAAWFSGISVPAGGRVLLGYLTGPVGTLGTVQMYGVSASGLDDNREVRLEARTAAGSER
jgi:hypothetical protein